MGARPLLGGAADDSAVERQVVADAFEDVVECCLDTVEVVRGKAAEQPVGELVVAAAPTCERVAAVPGQGDQTGAPVGRVRLPPDQVGRLQGVDQAGDVSRCAPQGVAERTLG